IGTWVCLCWTAVVSSESSLLTCLSPSSPPFNPLQRPDLGYSGSATRRDTRSRFQDLHGLGATVRTCTAVRRAVSADAEAGAGTTVSKLCEGERRRIKVPGF